MNEWSLELSFTQLPLEQEDPEIQNWEVLSEEKLMWSFH